MPRAIRGAWETDLGLGDGAVQKSIVVDPPASCEGFFVTRYRWIQSRSIELCNNGCIVSVIKGSGFLHLIDDAQQKGQLFLHTNVHVYVPPCNTRFQGVEPGTEIVCIASPTPALAIGKVLILRDESVMREQAYHSNHNRFIQTSNYSTCQVFLHHDQTLVSRNGNPISWSHTTFTYTNSMFHISHNYHTMLNIVGEVQGDVQVRMSIHPYASESWSDWTSLDNETCYYLDETEPMAEHEGVDNSGLAICFRNKHDISVTNGSFTIFGLCDPGLTGIEKLSQSAYSSYPRLETVIKAPQYEMFLRAVQKSDELDDSNSLRRAQEETREKMHQSTLL